MTRLLDLDSPRVRSLLCWLTERGRFRHDGYKPPEPLPLAKLSARLIAKFCRYLGIWGVDNILDLMPCTFYANGTPIRGSTHTIWPLGLLFYYRDYPDVHLVDGQVPMAHVWRLPWRITYRRTPVEEQITKIEKGHKR